MRKILLVIFDGLADRPIPELGNKTPLEVANIPNLNEIAARSICGVHNALPKGEYPTSEEAHFSIFGYDPTKEMPGRGVLEGLGIKAPIKRNDLALRVDFGTVDENLKVVDPRAGNIKSVKDLCELLGEIKIGTFTFNIYPGSGHRAVLVISGPAVSKEIHHHSTIVSDTDPHKSKVHRGAEKVLRPEPLDGSVEAEMTAKALWEYQTKTHDILRNYVENKVRERSGHLPANFILTRGAGFIGDAESFQKKYNLNSACIAGMPLYKGIAKYLGMDLIDVPGATGGTDTDVLAKVNSALEALKSGYDFVFLHIKGLDVVAEEEGSWEKKISFLEKCDKAMTKLKNFKGVLAITGDHATPCILKDHSDDSVPLLIMGGPKDSVSFYNEKSCARGGLGHISGRDIMKLLKAESENV